MRLLGVPRAVHPQPVHDRHQVEQGRARHRTVGRRALRHSVTVRPRHPVSTPIVSSAGLSTGLLDGEGAGTVGADSGDGRDDRVRAVVELAELRVDPDVQALRRHGTATAVELLAEGLARPASVGSLAAVEPVELLIWIAWYRPSSGSRSGGRPLATASSTSAGAGSRPACSASAAARPLALARGHRDAVAGGHLVPDLEPEQPAQHLLRRLRLGELQLDLALARLVDVLQVARPRWLSVRGRDPVVPADRGRARSGPGRRRSARTRGRAASG